MIIGQIPAINLEQKGLEMSENKLKVWKSGAGMCEKINWKALAQIRTSKIFLEQKDVGTHLKKDQDEN